VFAELFCFANACCCHHHCCCVQTRDNFDATRDKTESLMKKMLEVRQMVNTAIHVTAATMFVVADRGVHCLILNSLCVVYLSCKTAFNHIIFIILWNDCIWHAYKILRENRQ
jgi:hypothetical protein